MVVELTENVVDSVKVGEADWVDDADVVSVTVLEALRVRVSLELDENEVLNDQVGLGVCVAVTVCVAAGDEVAVVVDEEVVGAVAVANREKRSMSTDIKC